MRFRCLMLLIVTFQWVFITPCFSYSMRVQDIEKHARRVVQQIRTASTTGYERVRLIFIKKRSKSPIKSKELTNEESTKKTFESDIDDTIKKIKKEQEIDAMPVNATQNMMYEVYQIGMDALDNLDEDSF